MTRKQEKSPAEIRRAILALDKKKCAEDIDLMVGKWGASFVLQEVAKVFERIAEDFYAPRHENEKARLRAYLLLALSLFLTMEEPKP